MALLYKETIIFLIRFYYAAIFKFQIKKKLFTT